MELKMEQPKQYTPEEIAQLEKSRTISDAELLKGGAEYTINESGEKENLLATEKQKENVPDNIIRNILNKLEKSNKKIGSLVSFKEKGKVGQFMSTSQGKLTDITEEGIVVDESYYNTSGSYIPSRVIPLENIDIDSIS